MTSPPWWPSWLPTMRAGSPASLFTSTAVPSSEADCIRTPSAVRNDPHPIQHEADAMSPDTLKLYPSTASPNSRRVRIFLTEKGLKVPLVAIDLGKGEQHSAAYRAINPRRVVPTLVLDDGTAIGEVPAIMRYLDEAFPEKPLLGATPKDKGLIAMWERRAELEGFAAVMEGVRNNTVGLKGRAIAGPHDYEQSPALVERSVLRVKNFFADMNERLGQVPFVAGERYSAADITALVTVDFAKALELSVPADHMALKRWYETVSSRPSAAA